MFFKATETCFLNIKDSTVAQRSSLGSTASDELTGGGAVWEELILM